MPRGGSIDRALAGVAAGAGPLVWPAQANTTKAPDSHPVSGPPERDVDFGCGFFVCFALFLVCLFVFSLFCVLVLDRAPGSHFVWENFPLN